jgi:hypothetical protein
MHVDNNYTVTIMARDDAAANGGRQARIGVLCGDVGP